MNASFRPDFALDLGHDGIVLLRRGPQGWEKLGTVALDDPALTEALAALRSAAAATGARLATKLIIPNSQILYDRVSAPGDDPESRRACIAAALEGRTPYAVEDLVFDWSGEGEEVDIAVVARETLSEAETFARENGFNPVSFVARPEPGQFAGEPLFGPSAMAASLFGPGSLPEREQTPVTATVAVPTVPDAADLVTRGANAPRIPRTAEPARPEPEPARPEPEPEQAGSAEDDGDNAPEADAHGPAAAQRGASPETDRPASATAFVATDPARDAAAAPTAGTDLDVEEAREERADPGGSPPPADETRDTAGERDAPPREAAASIAPDEAAPAFTTRRASRPTDITATGMPESGAGSPPGADTAATLATRAARFRVAAEAPEGPAAGDGTPAPIRRVVTLPRPAAAGPAPELPSRPRPDTAPKKTAGTRPAKGLSAQGGRIGRSVREAQGRFDILLARLKARIGSSGTAAATRPPVEPPLPLPEKAGPEAPPRAAVVDLADRRRGTEAAVSAADSETAPPGRTGPGQGALVQRLAEGLRQRLGGRKARPPVPPPPAGEARPGPTGPAVTGAQAQVLRIPPAPREAEPQLQAPAYKSAVALGLPSDASPAPDLPAPVAGPGSKAEDFGLLGRLQKPRPKVNPGLVLTLVLIVILILVGIWAAMVPDNRVARLLGFQRGETVATQPAAQPAEGRVDTVASPGAIMPDLARPGEEAAAGTTGATDIPDTTGIPLEDLDAEALAQLRAAGIDPDTLDEIAALPSVDDDAGLPAIDTPELSAPIPPLPGLAEIIEGVAGLPQVETEAYLDDLYMAAIDRAIVTRDSAALPSMRDLDIDVAPGLQVPPPPPGVTFDLDERGFVRATPEGAETPSGARVFSGRPETVPPPRPGSAEPAASEPGTAEDAGVDESLRGLRPRPRPEGFRQQLEEEEAALRESLSGLRPRARPIAPQVAEAPEVAAPGRYAVDTAPRPGQRPENFAARVEEIRTAQAAEAAAAAAAAEAEAARQAQARAAASQPARQAAADPAAAAAAGPALPTAASVAREATQRRALRLSEINLIGVYGTPSKRRALVRLPSGRFVSVEVGDRLDGGQVAAISADSINYVRGGRTQTLRMPR